MIIEKTAIQFFKEIEREQDINKAVLSLISDIEKVLNLILKTEKLIKPEVKVLCLA